MVKGRAYAVWKTTNQGHEGINYEFKAGEQVLEATLVELENMYPSGKESKLKIFKDIIQIEVTEFPKLVFINEKNKN